MQMIKKSSAHRYRFRKALAKTGLSSGELTPAKANRSVRGGSEPSNALECAERKSSRPVNGAKSSYSPRKKARAASEIVGEGVASLRKSAARIYGDLIASAYDPSLNRQGEEEAIAEGGVLPKAPRLMSVPDGRALLVELLVFKLRLKPLTRRALALSNRLSEYGVSCCRF